jgi:hypothetical protein
LFNVVRLRSSRNSLSHDGYEDQQAADLFSPYPLFALFPLCEGHVCANWENLL